MFRFLIDVTAPSRVGGRTLIHHLVPFRDTSKRRGRGDLARGDRRGQSHPSSGDGRLSCAVRPPPPPPDGGRQRTSRPPPAARRRSPSPRRCDDVRPSAACLPTGTSRQGLITAASDQWPPSPIWLQLRLGYGSDVCLQFMPGLHKQKKAYVLNGKN